MAVKELQLYLFSFEFRVCVPLIFIVACERGSLTQEYPWREGCYGFLPCATR